MSTETTLRTLIRVNDAFKREATMRSKLEHVRRQLADLTEELQVSEAVRYTGWNVLLKKDGDGWKCVGIVHPDNSETIPEEFDMTLPIPNQETLPEFTGW